MEDLLATGRAQLPTRTTPRWDRQAAVAEPESGGAKLGLEVVPFDARQAELAAELGASTRHLRLSLADRACLALAMERGGTAVTADRVWSGVGDIVRVRVIR